MYGCLVKNKQLQNTGMKFCNFFSDINIYLLETIMTHIYIYIDDDFFYCKFIL